MTDNVDPIRRFAPLAHETLEQAREALAQARVALAHSEVTSAIAAPGHAEIRRRQLPALCYTGRAQWRDATAGTNVLYLLPGAPGDALARDLQARGYGAFHATRVAEMLRARGFDVETSAVYRANQAASYVAEARAAWGHAVSAARQALDGHVRQCLDYEGVTWRHVVSNAARKLADPNVTAVDARVAAEHVINAINQRDARAKRVEEETRRAEPVFAALDEVAAQIADAERHAVIACYHALRVAVVRARGRAKAAAQ